MYCGLVRDQSMMPFRGEMGQRRIVPISRRARRGDGLPTCRLVDEDGVVLGMIADALTEPVFGANAPTLYLRRNEESRRPKVEAPVRSEQPAARERPKGRTLSRLTRLSLSRIGLGLAVVLASACSSLPTELQPFDGTFDYVAFDEEGARVLEGQLVLDVTRSGAVTGTWEVDWAEGADQSTPVGPQVGSGSLAGTITGGSITVDLNPQVADDNVELEGTLGGAGIAGMWQHVTLAGPSGSGTFTATKR